MLLEEKGFQIITSTNSIQTYSLNGNSTDFSNINSHLLLDQQIFSSALSDQSVEIKDAIYKGNIIAVFDNSNKNYDYEKTLGLPIGFLSSQNSKDMKQKRNNTHKSIGYIYQADAFGGIHITRVNTLEDAMSNEEALNTFANILVNYEEREISTYGMSRSTYAMSRSTYAMSRSVLPTNVLGTIADYYEEEDSVKGAVNVMYEVSTVQDIDGYDYYAVHAFIDATPGDALYDSGWDLDELTTSLYSYSSDAILYKTGPNTMYKAKSYTVDLGVQGSKSDGLSGSANFSWTKELPVVDIKKSVLSQQKCEWIVDIDDWDDAADYTFSFEPGGVFRIKDQKHLTVFSSTSLTVDRWNKSPSTAVSDTTIFYCNESDVSDSLLDILQ